MALKKLFACNPLTVSFRPVPAFSCYFNTKGFPQDKRPKGEHVIEVDGYGEIARDLVNSACHSFLDMFSISRPSSSMGLGRTLNGLDRVVGVKPRWDVMEDAKALYIRRDMSGLGGKDVNEYKIFPRGDDCFLDYKIDDFGFKRVYRVMRNPPAILVSKHVEMKGHRPDGMNKLYVVFIGLPGRLYKTLEIKGEIDNGVFLLTIPKEKGNRICRLKHHETTLLFWPNKQDLTLQEICDTLSPRK